MDGGLRDIAGRAKFEQKGERKSWFEVEWMPMVSGDERSGESDVE